MVCDRFANFTSLLGMMAEPDFSTPGAHEKLGFWRPRVDDWDHQAGFVRKDWNWTRFVLMGTNGNQSHMITHRCVEPILCHLSLGNGCCLSLFTCMTTSPRPAISILMSGCRACLLTEVVQKDKPDHFMFLYY